MSKTLEQQLEEAKEVIAKVGAGVWGPDDLALVVLAQELMGIREELYGIKLQLERIRGRM